MRPHQFFFAAKPPPNDPESVSAPPHRVTLSPYSDLLRTAGVGSRSQDCRREWGATEGRVWFFSCVSFTGRFVPSLSVSSRRWCVRRQWSCPLVQLRQNPVMAPRGMVTRILPVATRRGGILPILMIGMTGASPADRTGKAASNRRARRVSRMRLRSRAMPLRTQVFPATSVCRRSLPMHATTSAAAIRPTAPASGARVS